ncbi:MAG: CARDB domain-containing protein, partial [Nanoarchaeota archaeon]
YKTKINGPYVLSFAKLSIGSEAKDIIFNAHTANPSSYADYEKPNLPDLKAAINKSFSEISNITKITINLSNIGNAPAFNVFLDIFNNETYSNNATLYFLDKNNFVIYNFTAANTSNATLFTAIVDFDNLVDESDETNNIINSLTTLTNDFDNDGIDDNSDTLIGNANSVNTTIANLKIRIGNLTDLTQKFNGTWKISFEDNGTMLMEFDFNLSKVLNLSKIMVERQSNSSFGYTIAHGLSLNGNTKTMHVDRTDTAINGVCIKDAEITSIAQISNNCNAANETKIECDGTLQSSYLCSYNSTTAKYKITGLNNSGIKQTDYAKPATSSAAAGGGGDGGGGGSSGSSGSCLESWHCNEWSECINNLQTRICSDINNCGTMISKPSEAKLCTTEEKTIIQESMEKNKLNYDEKSKNKYSLPDITGFLSRPAEGANPAIGALIVFITIIAGLFGYFY